MEEKMSIEEALEHYGVKGMHWGVRKKTPQEKARRQMDKIGSDRYLQGVNARGYGLQRATKRARQKDPNFNFSKLSPEQQAAYNKKGDRIAKRSAFLTSAGTMALYGGGLALGLKVSNLDPAVKKSGYISTGVLVAKMGKMTLDEVRSVNDSRKFDELRKIAYPTPPPKKRR